ARGTGESRVELDVAVPGGAGEVRAAGDDAGLPTRMVEDDSLGVQAGEFDMVGGDVVVSGDDAELALRGSAIGVVVVGGGIQDVDVPVSGGRGAELVGGVGTGEQGGVSRPGTEPGQGPGVEEGADGEGLLRACGERPGAVVVEAEREQGTSGERRGRLEVHL